jgi:hypothetical protein
MKSGNYTSVKFAWLAHNSAAREQQFIIIYPAERCAINSNAAQAALQSREFCINGTREQKNVIALTFLIANLGGSSSRSALIYITFSATLCTKKAV